MRSIPATAARVRAVLLACAAALTAAASASAADRVEISQGDDKLLHAFMFRPAGPGPFSAVVALHDCAGLTDKNGVLAPHYQDWGDRLAASGLAVLFPDSFGSRGVGSQCQARARAVRASRERIGDANAARRWLQAQSFIDPRRVSLLGWAEGAIAGLWTVRPGTRAHDGKPDFRTAVAFYPRCRRLGYSAWSARIPTLILIGGADDWTPSRECQQMVDGARGRSAGATIVVYPGAYHDFDRADDPVHLRSDAALTPDGSGRVHVGTDTGARADALRRVPEWLRR